MIEPRDKGKHKIRENIDAMAIAVLMAVLMKYFAIEAYQIPTSSMQPTMMGSKAAGVFDRILVDKSRYLLAEPKRWDIAVFRYPLRQSQNYVKRIVGTPGDELRMAGGNIYLVTNGDPADPKGLQNLRRPPAVQEEHWKQLYPARALLHGESRMLDFAFQGTGGDWSEAGGVLTVKQRGERGRSTLTFVSPKDGGLLNRVYDGYPAWVAKAMIDAGEKSGEEAVQDVRAAFSVTPTAVPAELKILLEVDDPDRGTTLFALAAENGEGRIVVERNGAEAASSAKFPLPLAAGSTTALRFAHLDDECIAEVDGAEVARLDCVAFRTLHPLVPSGNGGKVTLRVQVRGGDQVRVADLIVDRDLHYTPSSMPGEAGPPSFKVPEGHYFMMGDNTQQSVDSRDWTAITVGRSVDGRIVDPLRHPDAQKLRGNLRAISITEMPDPDENPVVVMEEKKVVFTDDVGEVWRLDGEIAMDPNEGHVYSGQTPWFKSPEGTWQPEQTKVHFVPREHIIGRPLLTFWPAWPWFRIGLIK